MGDSSEMPPFWPEHRPRCNDPRCGVPLTQDSVTSHEEGQPIEGGAYTADRTAALSGVPKSTIRYWANHGILTPSISETRLVLWSFADLIRLRVIYWLRQPKSLDDSRQIPKSSMIKIRRALRQLDRLGLGMFDEAGESRLVINTGGEVLIRRLSGIATELHGQTVLPIVTLLGPFNTVCGIKGPDLRMPRPELRIVPGKLSGEPHVLNTRLETSAIAALQRRGFTTEQLGELYPFANLAAIEQAIDLEDQLEANAAAA